MRALGLALAFSILASTSSGAIAQAPAGTPPAPAAQNSAPAKPGQTKPRPRRVPRTGTETAGASGFLPLPIGAILGIVGASGAAAVGLSGGNNPASPE